MRRSRRFPGTTLVWLRRDLRLHDNPALAAAVERGHGIVPMAVVHDPDDPWQALGAGAWLRASLASLASDLKAKGSRLVLRRGAVAPNLVSVFQDTSIGAVFFNRGLTPAARARDDALADELRGLGLDVEVFDDPHAADLRDALCAPATRDHVLDGLLNRAAELRANPLPAPGKMRRVSHRVGNADLADLDLAPADAAVPHAGSPGEAGARRTFEALQGAEGDGAKVLRARLAWHLAAGEISPRILSSALRGRAGARVNLSNLGADARIECKAVA